MLVYIRKTTAYVVEINDEIYGSDARQTVETDMGDDPDWYLENVAEKRYDELLLRAEGELGYSVVGDRTNKYAIGY